MGWADGQNVAAWGSAANEARVISVVVMVLFVGSICAEVVEKAVRGERTANAMVVVVGGGWWSVFC